MKIPKPLSMTLCALFAGNFIATAEAKPLKVHILAGQSNMQGHAKITTFDSLGDDPKTAPMLKQMRGADGEPAVADRVWISYLTGSKASGKKDVVTGKLTAGFGARNNAQQSDGKIGPEFTFGLTMQEQYDGPILIIKAAWGGTSIYADWLPPGNEKNEPAGTYY